jgi:hypothetical protein
MTVASAARDFDRLHRVNEGRKCGRVAPILNCKPWSRRRKDVDEGLVLLGLVADVVGGTPGLASGRCR